VTSRYKPNELLRMKVQITTDRLFLPKNGLVIVEEDLEHAKMVIIRAMDCEGNVHRLGVPYESLFNIGLWVASPLPDGATAAFDCAVNVCRVYDQLMNVPLDLSRTLSDLAQNLPKVWQELNTLTRDRARELFHITEGNGMDIVINGRAR